MVVWILLAAAVDVMSNTTYAPLEHAMVASMQTSSSWSADGRQLAVTFADGRLAIFTLGRSQPQWLIEEQPSGMALFSVDW